jgi:hypothetical protein
MTKPKGGLTLRGEFALAVAIVALGFLTLRVFSFVLVFINNMLGA